VTTLLIGNSRTQDMVGDLALLTPAEREAAGYGAHRMLWWARPGDVVVLPTLPDDDYVDYVTALTGTSRESLNLLAPAPGRLGAGILSADRLLDPAFLDALRKTLKGRPPDAILPVYADTGIAALASSLGAEEALPGHRFHGQGGSSLVNSKAAFRAVAAGAAVPIAPGTVVSGAPEAVEAIDGMLRAGHHVMAKLEFQGGGFGNEVLSAVAGVRPAGAPRTVVLTDRAAVERYVAQRWQWLTGGGGHRLVVERYFPEATSIYAEFQVTDDGVDLVGTGEMLMDPVVIGEIVPALVSLPAPAVADLVHDGRRLCEAYRTLGYRGTISADAFRTTAGDILFCEANGRITGSTHLHDPIASRLVGAELGPRRVLLGGGGWAVPSFRAAALELSTAGLAFDPATRTGVVLVSSYGPTDGTVLYCAVGADLAAARTLQHAATRLFTDA
jgi:hypothetical protein